MSDERVRVGRFELDTVIESLFLLALLIWTAYVLSDAFAMEEHFARFLPLVVAVPMLLVTVIQVLSLLSTSLEAVLSRIRLDDTDNIDEADPVSSGRDVSIFIALTLVYVVLAQVVGFFLAMPLFLFTYFHAYDSFHWKRSAAITVAVWFTVSFVFGTVFAVPGLDFGPFSAVDLDLF